MKKSFSKVVLAAALAVSMLLPTNAISASAATAPEKVEAYTYKGGYYYTGTEYGAPIEVKLDDQGDYVGDIKSSNKNLKVYLVSSKKNSEGNTAKIGIWTTKAGKYKVTFSVFGADQQVKETKTVDVVVKYYGNYVSPVAKISYAGKTVYNSTSTTSAAGVYDAISIPKSGKFKVTMKKGFKLKSIRVGKYQKKNTESGYSTENVYSSKKFKNGSKVTLSKQPYSYLSKSEHSEYNNNNMEASTYFEITYVNKKTKEEGTMTFSLSKLVNYVK